jgi:hypothetical protein
MINKINNFLISVFLVFFDNFSIKKIIFHDIENEFFECIKKELLYEKEYKSIFGKKETIYSCSQFDIDKSYIGKKKQKVVPKIKIYIKGDTFYKENSNAVDGKVFSKEKKKLSKEEADEVRQKIQVFLNDRKKTLHDEFNECSKEGFFYNQDSEENKFCSCVTKGEEFEYRIREKSPNKGKEGFLLLKIRRRFGLRNCQENCDYPQATFYKEENYTDSSDETFNICMQNLKKQRDEINKNK